MKKNLAIIIILSVCILSIGAHQLILALELGDSVKIEGSNLLPNLFYEHNLYNHRIENGDIIYCLDPEKVGTELSAYQGKIVDNLNLYSNQQIAILSSAILNGYPNILPGTPYRSFSISEYHSITAMAIRAICMEFKGMTRGKTAEEYISVQYGESAAKLECIKLIIHSKNFPYNEKFNKLSVKCTSDNIIVSEDGTNIGKEYILEGTNVSSPINILSIEDDNNLTLPEKLTIGQKFNIMVPKEKTFLPISKTMEINGKANNGLVYIKAGISNRQNYMGIIKINQNIRTTFVFNLDPNIAKLKVVKKDSDTQEILTGATFKVWSKKPENINDIENLIGTFVTNEEGFIEINNLGELGTYYISEIGAPVGYKCNENEVFEMIEVDKFGINYNKTIYNELNVVLENFIQIEGYKQLASNQPVEYKVFGVTNASNMSLENYSINIPIPHEYYVLDKTITIGEFKEKQGYLMYLTDGKNNTNVIKKSYNDEIDYLLSNPSIQKTRNIKGIFNSNDEKFIDVPKTGIKELTIKLAPESKGQEFRTPVFGKGNYSIYLKDYEKEYLLGTDFDGKVEHKFINSNLRSYRIIFDEPIFIDEFKTGNFSSNDKSDEIYSVMVNTDKRDNVLIKDNLEASKNNVLKLPDGEIVKNISIIFKDKVKPGFSLVSPILITGNSRDLKKISRNRFNGNGNDLYFSNFVEVKGEYEGIEVKNMDEWETSSYSKELKINKGKLPRTGSYNYMLMGFLALTAGIFIVIKWSGYHE